MKFIFAIIVCLGLWLQGAIAAEEQILRVHCTYYGMTKDIAEQGVVAMANSISKEAKQGELRTELVQTEDSHAFWVSRLTIEVTKTQLLKSYDDRIKKQEEARRKADIPKS